MYRRPTFSRIFRWTTLASFTLLVLALGLPTAADPADGESAAPAEQATTPSAEAVVCASSAQKCSLGEGNVLCWPADEACPRALSEVAEEHSAYETITQGPLAGAPASTRGTQEVQVRVSGCGKCFLSERTILPGDVQGVVLLESYSQGSVFYKGGHWAKNAFWEKACFGLPGVQQKCGTVQRTYLVYY